MTDKELKKLSRLELLRMLLEISKENEELKIKLTKAEEDIKIAKNIESISNATKEINTALEYANRITRNIRHKGSMPEEDDEQYIPQTSSEEIDAAIEYANSITQNISISNTEAANEAEANIKTDKKIPNPAKPTSVADGELYAQILYYYATHDDALKSIPDDIQDKIRKRIESILRKKKQMSLDRLGVLNADGEI